MARPHNLGTYRLDESYRKVDPVLVWIWFGRPIQPRTGRPSDQVDPPLDQDELPGLLTAWRREDGQWLGYVEYHHPVHGYPVWPVYRDWFPASRLRPRDASTPAQERTLDQTGHVQDRT